MNTEWTEIKTKNDLPKEENHNFKVIDKENKKEYSYHFLFSMTDYWLRHFSHWKKEALADS